MPPSIPAFIQRWSQADGGERANYQLFLSELCELLELPRPDPASADTENNAYVFERRVDLKHPDGGISKGFIDLYRRGCFVLEAKQSGKQLDSSGWDKAMLRAHAQADAYIRALPADEGRPPFLIVTDVGRSIELYAEFSRSGATYVPFPDPQSYRLKLADLAREEVRERLRGVWLEPLELDPARRAARVTREVAARLAEVAKSLEGRHPPEQVAGFLTRCLFTMFAEDVGLLPKDAFTDLLASLQDSPEHFSPMLEGLWQVMNSGGFSPQLRQKILRFNGGLFAEAHALALDKAQIRLLLAAARADWGEVEPAIFGTLLERALDPRERHQLGAHYTPRAYVERLVLSTVIEPLRAEWGDTQAAAVVLEQQGKHAEALKTLRAFQQRLCAVRVLDPACGSGNFLYVTLEHMKRLEGEVLNTLRDLGEAQGLLEMQGVTVSPRQFHGLELNPRAAAVAEMVLWIGYLQWHYRSHGQVNPPEPVLRDFHTLECRDALLDYDRVEPLRDEHGEPLTRWDGHTFKQHPVTGRDVPDESARAALVKYINPRPAQWPQADYIVGNPPFIGAGTMRAALGDGYVEAVRATWHEVPESADFVMYWWHRAALAVRSGEARAFGFITTNSLKQTFNRRVVQGHLQENLSLIFAVPDHPWVDAADGAAVRIAMTVGRAGEQPGLVHSVIAEREGGDDAVEVSFRSRAGVIHADLSVGANVAAAGALRANEDLCSRGVQLIGAGFIVSREQAEHLGLGRVPGLENHIREYRNGRDLTQNPRGVMVIDLFGLELEEVRARFPAVYQWVLERVKPERDHNSRASYRDNWWIFGEARSEWRRMYADLPRYIATVETSKHRFFTFLDKTILPDNMLVNIALDDPFYLGVLSSRIHVLWALRQGGSLEDRPRYNKTRCFETFPFPARSAPRSAGILPAPRTAAFQAARRLEADDPRGHLEGGAPGGAPWGVSRLAEQLDALRKQRQAEHPELTLTGMYNVLEKLRAGEPLGAKDKNIHDAGLVSVLRELHDELDAAVFAAYGWEDLAAKLVGRPGATTPLGDKTAEQAEAEEELLQRLVDLNTQRAAEEAQGAVQWLRPEFQHPVGQAGTASAELDLGVDDTPPTAAPASLEPWPKDLPEQIQAVRARLALGPQSAEAIAAAFKRRPLKGVEQVLAALEALGMAARDGSGRFMG